MREPHFNDFKKIDGYTDWDRYERAKDAYRTYQNDRRREQEYQANMLAESHRQTRLIEEMSVNSTEAYEMGVTAGEYLVGADATLDEDGTLSWSWTKPYESSHLNAEFASGVTSGVLSKYSSTTKAHMVDCARQAGLQMMTNFYIKHPTQDIKTKSFYVSFTRTLDETTGFVSYTWYHPFKDNELNNAYIEGVNESVAKQNTPSQCDNRLKTEVVELQEKRRKEKAETLMVNSVLSVFGVILLVVVYSIFNGVFSSNEVKVSPEISAKVDAYYQQRDRLMASGLSHEDIAIKLYELERAESSYNLSYGHNEVGSYVGFTMSDGSTKYALCNPSGSQCKIFANMTRGDKNPYYAIVTVNADKYGTKFDLDNNISGCGFVDAIKEARSMAQFEYVVGKTGAGCS